MDEIRPMRKSLRSFGTRWWCPGLRWHKNRYVSGKFKRLNTGIIDLNHELHSGDEINLVGFMCFLYKQPNTECGESREQISEGSVNNSEVKKWSSVQRYHFQEVCFRMVGCRENWDADLSCY